MKGKVLYIIPYDNTFINLDKELLKDVFEVTTLNFGSKSNLLIPFYLIRQLFLCLYYCYTNQTTLIQFGGYHSLLPSLISKIYKKKSIIVVHGSDACNFKEINYGLLRKSLPKFFCKYSYQHCTKIAPVSQSLIFTQNTYFNSTKPLEFGLLKTFPKLDKSKIKVIFNGLAIQNWGNDNSMREKNSFITVAGGQSIKQLRKGTDLIFEVASKFPDCKFTIIGLKETTEKIQIGNILYLPKVAQPELKDIFNKTEFYFQLSIFEGFGLALCEAMLCGCIPIVSNVNMMPEIIDDTGFVLAERNIDQLENLISKAKETPDGQKMQLSMASRDAIEKKYPINNRKIQIINLIQDN